MAVFTFHCTWLPPSLISVTAHLALLTFASERSLEAQSGIIYLQFARVKSEKNGKVEKSKIFRSYFTDPDWFKRNFCHHISDMQGVFCCIPYEYTDPYMGNLRKDNFGQCFYQAICVVGATPNFAFEIGILKSFAILLKKCDLYKFVLWCHDPLVPRALHMVTMGTVQFASEIAGVLKIVYFHRLFRQLQVSAIQIECVTKSCSFANRDLC